MRIHVLERWRRGTYTPDTWLVRCPKCGAKSEYFVHLTHVVRKNRRNELKEAAASTQYPWKISEMTGQRGFIALRYFPDLVLRRREGVLRCPQCIEKSSMTLTRQDQFWYYARIGKATIFAPTKEYLLKLKEYLAVDSRAAFRRKNPGWDYAHFRYIPKSLLKIRKSRALENQLNELLRT